MDSRDLELIGKYSGNDPILRNLFEEHKKMEKQLAKLGKKPFLTPSEGKEELRLKKLKLAGKDKMMRILEKYR